MKAEKIIGGPGEIDLILILFRLTTVETLPLKFNIGADNFKEPININVDLIEREYNSSPRWNIKGSDPSGVFYEVCYNPHTHTGDMEVF